MRRAVVVGCSGSGKSTFAAELARRMGCAHIELDSMFHQPGWVPLGADEFARRVREVAQGPAWVLDGNYSAVRDDVWQCADTVVWLDLPFAMVMYRVIARTIGRVVKRTELWNGNRESFSNLWSLNPEKSIIVWSAASHRTYRRRYAEATKNPRWFALTFVRLASRAAVKEFLQDAAAEDAEEGSIATEST